MTFVDTCYIIAVINRRDQYHARAKELAVAHRGRPLLITDAVLLEAGNALAHAFKREAVEIIRFFLSAPEVEIVRLTPELFDDAFALYDSHRDKTWGLIDCASFVVMRRAGVTDALT
jgi:predicted nucleic acid-binding protein